MRQEIVFQRQYRNFSPLRKLLTRICNKLHTIYMPLNWRALIEIILQGSALWNRAHKPHTLPSQRSESPLLFFDPSSFCTLFHPFFSSHTSFCLFPSYFYPLSLLLFSYYSPLYLPTPFSFHSYICLKDWNLTVTQLSYHNDKKHSWRNSVLEKHLGEEFLYLQLCFAFIVVCYMANTCGNCSKKDIAISHHTAGKDVNLLLWSCRGFSWGGGCGGRGGGGKKEKITLELMEYATATEKSQGGVGSKELYLWKRGCWKFPCRWPTEDVFDLNW